QRRGLPGSVVDDGAHCPHALSAGRRERRKLLVLVVKLDNEGIDGVWIRPAKRWKVGGQRAGSRGPLHGVEGLVVVAIQRETNLASAPRISAVAEDRKLIRLENGQAIGALDDQHVRGAGVCQ